LKRFITVIQIDGSENQLSDKHLPIIVGSSPDADIVLPGGDEIAAYIGDSQGHLFIQPYGTDSSPLFHNNRHLYESRWLKSQDAIQSGKTVISYHKRGDKLIFTVTELQTEGGQQSTLHPPDDPPPGQDHAGDKISSIPILIENRQPFSKRKRLLVTFLSTIFIFLGLAVLFVLVARPLEIDINPEPDSLSIQGFFPEVRLGERYLCIPGSYFVKIEKQGYYPQEIEFNLTRDGDNRLSTTLEKLPGILQLAVIPAGVLTVYSDNQLVGTTPPDALEIVPGPHRLKLLKDRYKPFTTELIIEGEGKTQTLKAQLEPDWADITITSEPPDAAVWIGDEQKGRTPLSIELLSGTHKVTLSKDRYVDAEIELAVVAGMDTLQHTELELQPGLLTLTTIPPGAAANIDRVYQGTTPLTLLVSALEDHQIFLTAPGYKPFQRQITLEPEEEATIDISLEQETGVVYLTTNPPHATVTINGKIYSNSAGRLVLPAAEQILEVKASGYRPATRTVIPKVGFSQQISIELLPENSSAPHPQSFVQDKTFQTSIGQKLRPVQPTTFIMGAPRREPGRRANERERSVIMKRPFFLSEKLVTNRQYRQFNQSHSSGTVSNFTLDDDNQPAVNISWEDAVRYLNWLSLQDKLQPFYVAQGNGFIAASPPTNGYRLPTEAEWSFAARQLNNRSIPRFPWNGTYPPRQASGNYADTSAVMLLSRIVQGYNDAFPTTSPVGSFPPNNGGFYDMGGNVSEWCHDYYAAYTSTLSNKPDPMGPVSGTHRVIRGSSWRDASVTELRLSYRAYHREPQNYVGFRIARYQ